MVKFHVSTRSDFCWPSHNRAWECPIIPRIMLAKTLAYNSQNCAGTLGLIASLTNHELVM